MKAKWAEIFVDNKVLGKIPFSIFNLLFDVTKELCYGCYGNEREFAASFLIGFCCFWACVSTSTRMYSNNKNILLIHARSKYENIDMIV